MSEIYAAVEFPDHPEWPVYEAPPLWYIKSDIEADF